jgi:hypothetical protein
MPFAMDMQTLVPIGTAVVAGLLGAPVWSYLQAQLNLKYIRRKDTLEELREQVALERDHAKACEEKLEVVDKRLQALEQDQNSYFARWILNHNKQILWMNDKAFLLIFAPLGFERDQLDGQIFSQLFQGPVTKELTLLEHAALAHHGQTQSALLQLHPALPFMVVIKVAFIGERGGDVLYEGCAYPPGDPEIQRAMGIKRQLTQNIVSMDNLLPGN